MKIRLRLLCLAAVLVAASVETSAQDWKSLLGGVVKNTVGDKMTTESSILGTWTYVAPDCQFDSDNLLGKAGGEVAAQEMEARMQKIFDTIGMESCQYTFQSDGTYSFTVKGKTLKGTYVFDQEAKTIEMKTKLGITTTAHVAVTGQNMSLLLNADKLMDLLKNVSESAQKYSSTIAAFNKLVSNYGGMKLGFELKK